MKKYAGPFLVIGLLFILPHMANSQNWGIKAGGTLSFGGSQEASVIYNPSNRLAAKGGVFFDWPIARCFSLRPEISFSLKGFRYYNVNWRATMSVTLNYIEIPVLLRLSFLRNAGIALGPYVGFLIKTPPLDDSRNEWTWRENKTNKVDAGICACLDYRFWRSFFVELQFSKGLAKVVYSPNAYSGYYDRPFRNATLSLVVGSLF